MVCRSAQDYIHMIKLIVNVLGNPDEKDMHFCSDKVVVQLGSVRLCAGWLQ